MIDAPKKIIYGHTKPIYCSIQLLDERICSGSADGLIKLWNPNQPWNQGSCDRTMRGCGCWSINIQIVFYILYRNNSVITLFL